MQNKVTLVVRIVFGSMFVVFGLNGFLNFIPMPTPTPQAGEFLGALFKTGFIFPVIKSIEVLVGLSLLSNKFTSFALVALAPILTVIVLHNFVLDTSGIPMATSLIVMFGYLVYVHRSNYRQLFAPKAL
jgi:putative oxidoreductase